MTSTKLTGSMRKHFMCSLRNIFKFQIAPHGSWTTTYFDQRPSDVVEESGEGQCFYGDMHVDCWLSVFQCLAGCLSLPVTANLLFLLFNAIY